ncbi:MAG: AAA family ATPase, partial [Clostridia bacterium]|nr:AAA family ATPase [Clostridia bacterium]
MTFLQALLNNTISLDKCQALLYYIANIDNCQGKFRRKNMAVLPLFHIMALPGAKIWLKTSWYHEMTGRTPINGDKVTVLFQKEQTARELLSGDSFYNIGVVGAIAGVDMNGFMSIRIQNRVNVEEAIVLGDKNISVTLSRKADIEDLNEDAAASAAKDIKGRITAFSEGSQWEAIMRSYAANWDNVWTIAAAMSPWISYTSEEFFAILGEDSRQRRFELVEKLLREGIEIADVQSAAQSAQQEDNQKLYRENAIKKQIAYLQKELDEMHPENVSELRRLELKLEEAGMNEAALKEGRKVLRRLKEDGGNSPESGMLTDWLDLLTGLPWKKTPSQNLTLDYAREVLDADHSGLEQVKKRILQQIAVMRLKGVQSGSILCFVGAPGTGKTSIGASIARALGRKYVRVSLGGVRDEADIRGHRRTYIGSMPGRIIDGINKAGVSNPVMVLDEVDKLSRSYNGDPASALLEVLDPEQNFSFTDHYLNVPFDLSDVLFICTANTLDTIPEPLLNRMEVIQFRGYTPIEKKEIALKHLLPKAMDAVGLPEGSLKVTDEALERIISDYTREGGVRGLKKRIDQLCRSAAVQLVDNTEAEIEVTADALEELLDAHPMHSKRVGESGRAGIVTGLAWTPVGGEILYI